MKKKFWNRRDGSVLTKTNYEIAKEQADIVDAQIIQLLEQRKNFRVEAGAGSGKTYSLNRVIEWIQLHKEMEYKKMKKKVACITYTNAAVDVIVERLKNDSFIEPLTIHSFAWGAIKQYQRAIIEMIQDDEKLTANETDFSKVIEVRYNLGHRYIKQGVQYLFHDDVLKLFVKFLDNVKFRRVFTNKYPLILIDEYQDSNKFVIDQFIKYYIAHNDGPQFGFFGDSWQTIYQSNNACGIIDHPNISVVGKKSNFRSSPRIVHLLNDIRPELPQKSAIDDFEGEVLVITCNDYTGQRRDDRGFKGELPADELQQRLNAVKEKLKNQTGDSESLKVLMITHKILAKQQGYERVLEILNDGLRDKQDIFLIFFMNTVEQIYKSLKESDMQLLFDTLGVKRFPIQTKNEKVSWQMFKNKLELARNGTAFDIVKCVIDSKLVPIPPQIISYIEIYKNSPKTLYSGVEIEKFLKIPYSEFIAAINFLYPEADFSTEHGVKGEEYDNVIFVISKGWNQYQFEKYMPMLNKKIPDDKRKAFEKNRNLFYVCCSRPKKRLIFFISIEMEAEFTSFLEELVGKENIMTYGNYMDL